MCNMPRKLQRVPPVPRSSDRVQRIRSPEQVGVKLHICKIHKERGGVQRNRKISQQKLCSKAVGGVERRSLWRSLYTDKDTAIDGMIGYVHDERWDKEEANALEKAIKERRDSLFKYGYCESFQMDTRTRPNGPKRPMDYDFYLEERQLYFTPDWDK